MDSVNIKIVKDDLIREIADSTYTSQSTVRSIYEALEHQIYEHLSMVNNEQSVTIKLFEGFNIDGTYIPEKEKINNLNGKKIKTISKIKPKATFTRTYCEKLSSILRK